MSELTPEQQLITRLATELLDGLRAVVPATTMHHAVTDMQDIYLPALIALAGKIRTTDGAVATQQGNYKGELLGDSEEYARLRAMQLTPEFLKYGDLPRTQWEIMHDAIMAGYQAGALRETENLTVEAAIGRMEQNGDG